LRRAVALALAAAVAGGCVTRPAPAPPQANSPISSPRSRPSPRPPREPAGRPPKLTIETRTRTYPVSGTTPATLLASIARRGPGRFAAETTYAIAYGYTKTRIGGRCAATSVLVELTVEFLYPRWTDAGRAPAATRAYWRATIARLRRHEDGHRDLAERTARDMMRALASIRPRATCTALARAVRLRAGRIGARGDAAQRRYDARTRHGLAA
jgi:predicted secreted Zn-dependent protease